MTTDLTIRLGVPVVDGSGAIPPGATMTQGAACGCLGLLSEFGGGAALLIRCPICSLEALTPEEIARWRAAESAA